MKIGVCASIELEILLEYLYPDERNRLQGIQGLAGTQPAQLAVQFIKMGYEVSVFTMSQDIPYGEFSVFRGEKLTVYLGHFRRNKMCVLDFQAKEVALLKKMIAVDKPDVLSCHWTYEFAMAGILSRVPMLITVRDWSPEVFRLMRKPYRFMRMIMSFFVYMLGKKFIANSSYIEQKLRFLKGRNLGIIPNGMDDELFFGSRKTFHKPQEMRVISINNGFGELKNVKVLIRAFHALVKEHSAISLCLVGDGFGPDEEAYRWCQTHGLLDNIEFMGKQEHKRVVALLDSSDVLVHPAKEESFGNILIEAMARKVPVIAGAHSGAVPWVVDDSGVLVDINSETQIQDSIRYFIENPQALSEYAEKGYNNAFSRFRLSNVASEYVRRFNDLLENAQ